MPYNNAQERGRPITIKDEGLTLVGNVGSIDFQGAGVTGSAIGSDVTEEIPGGGAGAVDSVNGQTGVVVLDTGDIAEAADANYVSDAQLTVIGNTSGTNTGDQTSIVGITGTKAEFDTAVTDGNFLYVGDVTQYTDEMAQDAVGAMVDASLTYVDGTPSLGVAANIKKEAPGFTIDGGGSAISTGKVKGFFTCPYAGAITAWSIVVDTGTVTVKVWKIVTGTAKPTSANSINTSGVAISSGTAIRSTTLTDFTTTTVSAGDIFAYNIEAVASVTEMTFNLEITRT